ncbi:iron uptake porin [Thermosynechococcus sp. HN-54]|uniref:iron uptake porin n=1 Tax=Thermosynechococcus sp. HN-54 TaxID=2933959 RepID=UPI00202CC21D|nr:iron uptake porin [Thermosynechococcus sp. HN-54]URR34866.1 iron uptake porin [Thermosynechococcus sp. HN-54]
MSRIFPGWVLTSPVLLLGVFAGGATAADTSLTNFSATQFQTPTTGAESLSTLPNSPALIAQNRRSSMSTPSVAELEAGGSPSPTASMGQVTSVSQLSDVRPTDWAYQALASLVEKYGCIAGYPDGTFRGNRAATRYEMAAALNACLDVISDRFATKEDLEKLRRLMQEFAKELAVIKGRVTNLEGRVANLEATQFATLTKLNATIIFNVSDILTNDQAVAVGAALPVPRPEINDNTVVNNRVRLNLDTSFYGKDRLRLRLQAANIQNYAGLMGTNMGRLGYDGDSGNQFELQKAFYSFPVTSRGQMILDFRGGEFNDNFNNFNPFLQSSDTGALSRFGRFNPIYRAGNAANAAGVSFKYDILQNKERGTGVTLNVGYLAPNASNPQQNAANPAGFNNAVGNTNGFFDGAYAALAQLDVRPVKNLALGVTYVHSFGLDPFGGTGSTGNFSAANPTRTGFANSTADSFGFQFTYRPIKQFNIAGWVGYSSVDAVQNQADYPTRAESAEVLNWAVTFAAPDLWNKGDVLGLIFGQPPQVISLSNTFNGGVPGPLPPVGAGASSRTAFNSYHLEGFYRFAVNRNISITPGVIAIFNPNSNSVNDPIVVGAVRTTFSF